MNALATAMGVLSIVEPSDEAVSLTFVDSFPDPIFDRHLQSSLIWLPKHGMGYLPVSEQPYDARYFEKYQHYANTTMGARITAARIQLIASYRFGSLIDVGIGCGSFIEAARREFRAYDVQVRGSDINPVGVQWLHERACFADPYVEEVDALTFWDSLEHIPDVSRLIANARKYVFCSLPIVPGDGPPSRTWRHYRPTEHCWYFTRRGLIRWMEEQGFACIECNAMETVLGREDVESFVFKRSA